MGFACILPSPVPHLISAPELLEAAHDDQSLSDSLHSLRKQADDATKPVKPTDDKKPSKPTEENEEYEELDDEGEKSC